MSPHPFSYVRKVGSLAAIFAGASLALLALGVFKLSASPSRAAFPGSNGKIAFALATGINTIDPDGSNEHSLISGASAPAWSPDGTQMAYVGPHNGGVGIFVAEADGSNPQFIALGADPSWSPDGKKLVYMGGTTGLCIYDLSTHGETQITHIASDYVDYHGMPAWEPDGDRIVFFRSWYTELPYEHYDLWLVNSDGTGLAQLTDVGVGAKEADPGQDFAPGWSPDGEVILFARSAPEAGIYQILPNGSLLTLVRATPGSAPYPTWSPDGDKIAYVAFNSTAEPDAYEIHVLDGSEDQTILTKTTLIADLDWGVAAVEHEFIVNSDLNLSDDDAGDGACDTGNDLPGGDPECTLLAAVQEANALSGKDTITFDIPGSGVPLIEAPDGFDVTDPVVIDGSTQSSGKVEIDGGHSYGDDCGTTSNPEHIGFRIAAGQSTLRGLVIHGYCSWGIALWDGSESTVIEGSFIGTDASGTQALGNGGMRRTGSSGGWTGGGILILSDNNLIGGTNHTPGACDGACNLIAGNSLASGEPGDWEFQPAGICIMQSAMNNTIYGNFIGTDITGKSVPAGGFQQRFGIEIKNAEQNVIGGNTLGGRNLISGNEYYGVLIHNLYAYPNPNNNNVRGNLIGTDAAGVVGVGSGQAGVMIQDSRENQVLDNVIASKDKAESGVILSGELSRQNTIQDNRIGTAADGATAIGIYFGVVFQSDPSENVILNNMIAYGLQGVWVSSGSDNQISGNSIHHHNDGVGVGNAAVGTEISDNVIHDNEVGVRVVGDAAVRNRITANAIYANAPGITGATPGSGLGIDLDPQGLNANDYGDLDTGPNTLLNFPLLGYAAVLNSGDLRTGGTYDGLLGSHTYRLEFFANPACDPSGYGEGQRYLGFADVTTDSTGRVVIDVTLPQAGASPGQFITATAIDQSGNTSEFSRCVEARPGDSLSTAAGVGATEVAVGDTGSFREGDLISINPGGANQEDNRVIGFGSLLLASPLQFAHSAGEPVIIITTRLYLPLIQ